MVYITQLIYIKEGQETIFYQFEEIAIPLISKYNGKLLLRIHPEEKNIIEQTIETPFEIHLVSFETEADLQNFMQDEERRKFLHLKEQSIKNTLLIKGDKLR
jgi:hypothetical protein